VVGTTRQTKKKPAKQKQCTTCRPNHALVPTNATQQQQLTTTGPRRPCRCKKCHQALSVRQVASKYPLRKDSRVSVCPAPAASSAVATKVRRHIHAKQVNMEKPAVQPLGQSPGQPIVQSIAASSVVPTHCCLPHCIHCCDERLNTQLKDKKKQSSRLP